MKPTFVAAWPLLLAPYLYFVHHSWSVVDDAFISFRYARNLVLGHGLRYNLGEQPPVEGYSNFLWVLAAAFADFLGLDPLVWIPVASTACGVILLCLVHTLLCRSLILDTTIAFLAALGLGCSAAFAVWSSTGMETMAFALVLFVSFERLVLREPAPDPLGGAIAGLLLVLVRTEGIAWFGLIWGIAIVSRRMRRQPSARPLVAIALVVGFGFAAYLAWRMSYYGDWLPNTAYAKRPISTAALGRGVRYVVVNWLTLLSPLWIFPASWVALRRGGVGPAVVAMAWAIPAYAITVTGDFMAMGRLLLPGLPFQAILFAFLLRAIGKSGRWKSFAVALGLASAAASALPLWNLQIVPRNFLTSLDFRRTSSNYRSEHEQWRFLLTLVENYAERGRGLRRYAADVLKDPGASFVTAAIGAVGYHSGLFIYDRCGLVTQEVGRRELGADEKLAAPGHDRCVDYRHFLKDEPTLLRARVLSGSDRGRIAREFALSVEPKIRERYVADFLEVPRNARDGQRTFIWVLRRIEPEESPDEAWAAFEARRLHYLETGEAPASLGEEPDL